MAERIRGITVELGADTTGISKALSGINKELTSTQKQLRDVEKLLKLDPDNVELLRQKQELLNRAITESNTKLETLRQAEARLKNAGIDENSDQFMALRREIISTEQALNGYNAQMDEATGNTREMSAAQDGASASSAKFVSWIAAIAAAAAKAGKSIVDMAVSAAAYADEILTASTVTSVSAERLQELKYAADLVDVSVETITTSMARNIRSMRQAADGTATAAEAYAALGVEVTYTNGELRDGQEVYWEAIDALGRIEDETQRDAIAMQIFGRSAQELNPLIETGAAGMAEFAAEAREAGYVLSGDTLAQFGAFDDTIQRLSVSGEALKNSFARSVIPALQDVSGTAVEYINEVTGKLNEADADVIDIVADILYDVAGYLIDHLDEITDFVVEFTTKLTEKLIERLPEILIKLIWSVIKSTFQAIFGTIQSTVESIFSLGDYWKNGEFKLPQFADGGILTRGSAIVGERGPELLTNVGGKSVVTPLTGGTAGETLVTVNFNGSLSALAAALEPYITAETTRKGGTFS